MKRDNTIYKCVGCRKVTQTLHELWHGRGVRVEYAIKYHLQAPVCPDCHIKAHRNKKKYQIKFCYLMGFGYTKINLAVNQRDHEYLESIAEENLEKIKKYLQ